MKRVMGLLLVIFLVACNSENEVHDFIVEYKKEQYTITDYQNPPTAAEIEENVQRYLSTELQEKHHLNRVFSIAPTLSTTISKNIKVDDVQISEINNDEAGTKDYKYTITLKIYDETTSETVKKEGELTISTKDGYTIVYENEDRHTKIGNEEF